MHHPYAHALRRAAQRHPFDVAVVDVKNDVCATWGELAHDAACIAGALAERGIGSGDLVIVRQSNTLDYLRLVMGIDWAGAAPVPTLGILSDSERDRIDSVVDPALVIDSEGDIGDLLAGRPIGPVDGLPSALSQVLFTSGSSGAPKGVVHSYASTAAAMAGWLAVSGLENGDVVLVTTPVSHAAGRLLEAGLLTGATVVLLASARAAGVVDAAKAHGVTHMIVVPTVLAELLEDERATSAELPSLEFVMYASAPASPSLIVRAQERLGPILHTCYGSTEAPLPVTHLDAIDHTAAASSSPELLLSCGGEFAFGAQIRIIDETGAEAPDGEPGQLAISTPGLAVGYWQAEEQWRERMAGDWFLTGDIGTVSGGRLFLSDRQDDMIITGGFNVFPTEVEGYLMGHPAVREAAVIGVPDQRWGEAVVAVVSTRAAVEQDVLIAYCRAGLSGHKVPKSIRFVEELPKSGHGKVARRTVREHLLSDTKSVHGAG